MGPEAYTAEQIAAWANYADDDDFTDWLYAAWLSSLVISMAPSALLVSAPMVTSTPSTGIRVPGA